MKHIVDHGKKRPLGWEQVYKVTGAAQQSLSSIVRVYDTGTDSASTGADGHRLPLLLNVTSARQDAIVADSERYYLNSCCPATHGATNSGGPGGPTGPLCTPFRTPWALSRPSITH
jgi:hypothetical protein